MSRDSPAFHGPSAAENSQQEEDLLEVEYGTSRTRPRWIDAGAALPLGQISRLRFPAEQSMDFQSPSLHISAGNRYVPSQPCDLDFHALPEEASSSFPQLSHRMTFASSDPRTYPTDRTTWPFRESFSPYTPSQSGGRTTTYLEPTSDDIPGRWTSDEPLQQQSEYGQLLALSGNIASRAISVDSARSVPPPPTTHQSSRQPTELSYATTPLAARSGPSADRGLFPSLAERVEPGPTYPEDVSHVCSECGKSFQRASNLRAHNRVHDTPRSQPYACPDQNCNNRFSRRTDLSRHEQSVHLRARDYVCELCERSFSRKDTLRRHTEDGCPMRATVGKRSPRGRGRPTQTPT